MTNGYLTQVLGVLLAEPAALRSGTSPVRPPWIGALSARRNAFAGLSAALLLFAGGCTLDWLVSSRLIPTRTTLIWVALVASLVGSLVFKVLCDAGDRRRALVTRLQTIADINHHIRNALQVIAYHARSGSGRSDRVMEDVDAAVSRIEWVLREVLPQHEQDAQTIHQPDSGGNRVLRRQWSCANGPGA